MSHLKNNARIHVASAPVSWGVMEETDTSVWPSAGRVLDEIVAAGYDGTELGPGGYFPTDPEQLRSTLDAHRLTLTSAFVPLRWFQPDRLPADVESLMNVARLLAALDCPFVVVADGVAVPGEVLPDDAAWAKTARAMEDVARQVQRLGLQLVFHLEAGSRLATPDDQARLCALTDPELVGICLDTGHYAYSFGDPRDAVVRQRGARDALDFYAAVKSGVFTPLGHGCAEIAAVVSDLLSIGYEGWLVAEQDVLMPLGNGRTPLENARQSREFLRQLGL